MSNDSMLSSILRKTGDPEIITRLTENLSSSELQTLLLEVFRVKTAQLDATALARQYEQNRFVQPASVDPIAFNTFCIAVLEKATAQGYEAIELSPLSPLGTCSAMALVDQNNVVSALRGTEVTADASNLLALECARRRKAGKFSKVERCCAVHRHVRAAQINVPGFTPHFGVYVMVTAGKDEGSCSFEKTALTEHFRFYANLLTEIFGKDSMRIVLRAPGSAPLTEAQIESVTEHLRSEIPNATFEISEPKKEGYYRQINFRLWLRVGEQEHEIADGGIVDWTAKLSGNQKERFFISGLGTEFLWKMMPDDLRKKISFTL